MYYNARNALIYYKHDFSRRYRNSTSELNIEFAYFNKMASETSFTALLEDSFSDNDKSTEDYSSNLKISFRIMLYSRVTIYILMMKNDLFPTNYPWRNYDHDALENLTERYDTELLQQALQQSLSSCSDNLLAEKIFNEILPFAYYLLSEVKRIILP